jgi:glycosyltransferase involved in cell wall biosynthesis
MYIGDVPPEATVESPSLLYRLLEEYPRELLSVVYRAGYKSVQTRRLDGLTYKQFHLDSLQLPYRYGIRNIATLFTGGVLYRGLRHAVRNFRPEAILTIAHGFGCLPAATLARRLCVPLHLVLHDDWLTWVGVPQTLLPYAGRRFASVYRQAESRLCISPYMEDEYRSRYGVSGKVLYPQRPKDLPRFEAPAFREGKPVVAFAGTVWEGYAQALRKVARVLGQIGGKLLIFSQHSESELGALGLTGGAVDARPFIPASRLVELLRRESDMLLVLMDFRTSDNCNMLYAFPSKLSVYTAVGLPIIIWGPPQCSAVRWARDNNGVAEVVDSEDLSQLERVIHTLSQDRSQRFTLATKSLALGEDCFSYDKCRDAFYECLVGDKVPPA